MFAFTFFFGKKKLALQIKFVLYGITVENIKERLMCESVLGAEDTLLLGSVFMNEASRIKAG